MKKTLFTAILILIFIYAVSSAYTQSVCEEFVRFHITADSDSPYDQLVKMNLRNHIFEIYSRELSHIGSKEKMLEFISDNLTRIKNDADSYLKSINYDKTVEVAVTRGYFPKKDYGSFSLPFGKYDAFRIKIGSGKGKNFFCVMFPPSCVSKEMTEAVTDKLNSRKIIYKFKFF